MPKPLVIVESPAKARTISRILGSGFVVESSVGHVRDLPRSASEIPEAQRNEAIQRTGGVDVDSDFKALYVVPREKKSHVTKLKAAMKEASELLLATDEDREGESIAWHLLEVLSPRIPVKRMVFHEITKPAILHAVENPRDLDRRLVDAQEARRILDRLVGWEVSPVLWRKISPGLSAGRVQSVAIRMIVERERARIRFRSASFWDLEGTFQAEGGRFSATLAAIDGVRLATTKDFDESGSPRDGITLLDEPAAGALAERLAAAEFAVRSVDEKPWKRSPHAPFMTSTLQQEAGRKLRYSVHRTMRVAQSLYENGYITYMRTDSVTLSETAIAAARAQAEEMFGAAFVAPEPRVWTSRVRNAQEAHEAIRPAGDTFRTPEEVRGELRDEEFRLYELIWMRTLASEMADARGKGLQVRLGARTANEDAEFAASGRLIEFPGFLRAYVEGSDDPDAELEDQEVRLPALAEGESLAVVALEPKSHETQPPPRYTEASLVKALEEMGVGRPSTYASIIDTIEERGYVLKRGATMIPSWVAFAVVGLLEDHFRHLVDYEFTARMEDDLDEIAAGDQEAIPYLRRFYFGNGNDGLRSMVSDDKLAEIDAREVNSIPLGTDAEGVEVVARVGRYGPYVQRGEQRTGIPEDLAPDELTVEKAVELLEAPSDDRELGTHPETGEPVRARAGRYGPYIQLGEPEADSKERPRTASLFRSMSLETVTLEEALRLLGLPRTIGADPADGVEITAQNGRYGPYISKGKDTRSLETEEQIFGITVEEALALLAQPKRRGRRAVEPLRELGDDPASGKPVVLREGRYGPYVTDGETNASLRRSDDPGTVTIERAAELLAERRAKGPPQKKKKGRPRKKKP